MTHAISLHQPYATIVALGWKTIETRPRRTNHRSDLVICSSLKIDEVARATLERRALERGIDRDRWRWLTSITGRALCVVRVTHCRELVPEDEPAAWFYAPGRFAWQLFDRRCFEAPPKARGSQGFWPAEKRGIDPTLALRPGEGTKPWQGIGELAPVDLWMGAA